MAEQRGHGMFETTLASNSAPVVFILTSIVWREAWKYGDRAVQALARRGLCRASSTDNGLAVQADHQHRPFIQVGTSISG